MSDFSGTALDHVRERLERFRAGDTDAVSGDEAAREASRAVAVRPTPEGVAAVAWLYQFRALAAGELGGEEAQLAFTLFGKVAGVLPGELPPHVADGLVMARADPHGPLHRLAKTVARAEHLLENSGSSGSPAMLDQSIEMLTRALDTWPADAPRRHDALGLLGRALRRRYAFDPGELWRLDNAVSVLTDAVAAIPAGDLLGHTHAHALCSACLDRHDSTGDLRDLEAADQANAQALRLVVAGDPQRPRLLIQRADVLRSRTSAGADSHWLEEAAAVCREAVRTVSGDNPARPYVHATAANVLGDCYVYGHDPAVLDEAIDCSRTAMGGVPEEDDRSSVVANHGRLLMLRARHTGDPADLGAAEDALAATVGALPPGHSGRTAYQSDLADTLYERHRATGDEACLREALEHARQSVDLAAENGTVVPALLNSLGRILIARYETIGDPTELAEGVERLRQAEEQSPPGSRMRGIALVHLGNGLVLQAALAVGTARRNQAYAEAMTVLNAAVDALPPGPDRQLALNNLATLVRRHDADDRPDALRRAHRAFREILSSAVPESQAHELAALNLALNLMDEHEAESAGDERAGDGPLSEAERLLRAAYRQQRPGMHAYATVTCALARCLALRATAEGRGDLYTEAVALLRSVTAAGDGCSLAGRASAANQLGVLHAGAGEWAAAEEAYAEGIDLLSRAAAPQLGRAAQERNLGAFFGLASDAAASALGAGRPARAVELLEKGRGLLLPTLRHDPRPSTAHPVADGRTVAVINIGRLRCDALIVRDGAITVVPLPRLSHAALIRQAGTFLWAVQRSQDPACPREDLYKAQHVAVPGVLRWLWHTTVRPVLDALGLTAPAGRGTPWPRIWWCPTGLMSFLPLHAAGDHGSLYDGSTGDGALDRVVSSYAPTLRTLEAAARRADALRGCSDRGPGDGGLLVVAPEAPGTAGLPQVPREVAAIRSHRPGSTVLFGAQATKERILQEVPRHAWFHFAGHGTQNAEVADSASLLPHDYLSGGLRIGLSDLGELSLDGAQLAFLSACQTAVGHLTLADEHTHIAGLLQAMGFAHVVATQWTVRDGAAAEVAAEFHRLAALYGNTFDPAFALHAAVREIRNTRPRPYEWAPFVHFGP
ncbi:CHAT domain-containing protein [Streptomyces liliifuscus]|uniref:CHAT domain-containing protein n=1 Tax=Streptomyces liliifuscus TaxID=2797636 RepID=A0A7T7I0G5_9ACTN|nr:CHAT domain-containing protein [Streptomyces liliifuscus]QQM38696.1 CHAT domain-containing protein [Streptomyces liliifuscus]